LTGENSKEIALLERERKEIKNGVFEARDGKWEQLALLFWLEGGGRQKMEENIAFHWDAFDYRTQRDCCACARLLGV
jgi:hypothetical protein